MGVVHRVQAFTGSADVGDQSNLTNALNHVNETS